MTVKILFAPNHPKPILDVALALKPPGFDLLIHDNGTPDYYRAAAEAEYYMGLTRNIDAKFFAAAKKMRLVQLLSAGFDRADVAAAKKAGIPIANNGGANAIAVAEHTLMLILATLKKLTGLHADVSAGEWRTGASSKACCRALEESQDLLLPHRRHRPARFRACRRTGAVRPASG